MEKENYIFQERFQNILLKALKYPPAKNVENILRKYIEDHRIVAAYVKNSRFDNVAGAYYQKHKKILINLKKNTILFKLLSIPIPVYLKPQLEAISVVLVHELIHFIYNQFPKETTQVSKNVLVKFYLTFLKLCGIQEDLNSIVTNFLVDSIKHGGYSTKLIEVITESKNSTTELCDKETKRLILKGLELERLKYKEYIMQHKREYEFMQLIFRTCYLTVYDSYPKSQIYFQELHNPDEVLSISSNINTPQAIKTYTNILKILS
jgi:hypothetical protein